MLFFFSFFFFGEQEEPPYDPSQEFNELIKTTSGNEFFVVKPDKSSDTLGTDGADGSTGKKEGGAEEEAGEGEDEGREREDAAFLTEVEAQGDAMEELPDYISSIDIPQDVIIRVKKA